MSIYRYEVEYIFCGHKNSREFSHISSAAAFALSKLDEGFKEVSDSLSLIEIEYANEKRAEQHLSITSSYLWAAGFHEKTDLLILVGRSQENGSAFIRNGEIFTMAQYTQYLSEREKSQRKVVNKGYERE